MKKIRKETETTPIGQKVEIQWYSGTPEEVERELREKYLEINVQNRGGIWCASIMDGGGVDGDIRVYRIALVDEIPETRMYKTLAEAFGDGAIEFCAPPTI